jgi:hypothetical protein
MLGRFAIMGGVTGQPSTTSSRSGLCPGCEHVRVVRSGRGSVFLMCERGLRREAGYPKYPRLPVMACVGYERAKNDQGPLEAALGED